MGFNNPDVPWKELERTLSDRARAGRTRRGPAGANGGDSPAWSPVRSAYVPPPDAGAAGRRRALRRAPLPLHLQLPRRGQPRPRSWPRRRPASGLEALALTDHDGFYGVVRFAEAARAVGVPTVFGAELSLGLTRPQNGKPDPEGTHLLVLARDPRGLRRRWRPPSAPRSWPAPRRASRSTTASPARTCTATTGWCSPAAARARCPQALEGRRPGGRGPRARRARSPPSAATTWWWSCATTATRSTRPATTRWPSWPCGAGVEVVATTNAHYATPAAAPPGHRHGRGAGPPQPRRARRLAARPAPAPTCARARSRPAASPAGPARWRRPPSWAGPAPSTCSWWRRSCRRSRAPTASTRWRYLRRLTAEGAAAPLRPAGRRAGPGRLRARSTTSSPSSSSSASPATSSWCGTSSTSAGARASTARAGAAPPTARSATRSASPTPTRWRSACCSSGSCRRSATGRPTSTSTSSRAGGRRPSSTSTSKHGRRHAAQVANVITYRAKSSVRDMAKALGYAPGQQDAWSKQVDAWGGVAVTAGSSSRSTATSPPTCWSWPPRSSTRPATSASTPAAW